jgi:hypothetical protein
MAKRFDVNAQPDQFRERVIRAAEAALKAGGSVGPLELLQHMRFLDPVHVDGWRKGNEHYRALEEWIQVGPEKFGKTLRCFAEWVKERGLRPIEASYTRRGPRGVQELYVTADGNVEREKFYRTHYGPAELPARKARQLSEKLAKPPDLVVFQKVSDEGACSECGVELAKGSFLCMEKQQPLCLVCADLDHLVFLPAGDMALSRRSRKHSVLSAVVVRFSRARNRYERQGLLVTSAALARAEEECAADAPERALRRAQAAVLRQAEDREFVSELTKAIRRQYPGCPAEEVGDIAAHTAVRGSGRVGRSAAGRELDPQAIKLAVMAHIRHSHTNYDELLMRGTERTDARTLVREKVEAVMERWTHS